MNCLNEDLGGCLCDHQAQVCAVGLQSGLWHMGYIHIGISNTWRCVWRSGNFSALRMANYPAFQSRGKRFLRRTESYILDIYSGGSSEIRAHRY
jgi:hypothetical protein